MITNQAPHLESPHKNRERGADTAVQRSATLPGPITCPSTLFVIDYALIYNLGLMVGAAAILVLTTRALRIPTIILYMMAGLFLGPLTGLVGVTEAVDTISEVGIALLLFLVGLELDFNRIKDAGPVAMAVATVQMAVTFLGALGLALLLGFGAAEAIVLGIAMMFSSTVVVVKLLGELNHTRTLYGRISIGVLLMQDLVVVVVLAVVAGMGAPGALEATALVTSLAIAFLGMGALLVAALLASKYLLPGPFRWMARMPEGLFIWALLWCFVFVIAAEEMHLSVEIGAFLAGISIAQLHYSQDLERWVHPLMNFFIAVFFVSLGVQMELGAALDHIGAVVVFSVLALIGKPILIAVLVGWRGYDRYTAFTSGITLAQISEFSLIFGAMALGVGLIDAELLSLIAMIALITMGISSFMVLNNDKLYHRVAGLNLLRFLGGKPGQGVQEENQPEGHVIVVGMNPMGRYIVERLAEQGEAVLAIDTDPVKLEGLPAETLSGDAAYKSVLKQANLLGAKLVVSALQIEAANNLIAYRCRKAGVPCASHAFDQSVAPDLKQMGVDYLIDSKFQGTRKVIQELRSQGVLK